MLKWRLTVVRSPDKQALVKPPEKKKADDPKAPPQDRLLIVASIFLIFAGTVAIVQEWPYFLAGLVVYGIIHACKKQRRSGS